MPVSMGLSPVGIQGDLFAYGSFQHKEPNELNTWQQVKNQPKKIAVQESANTKQFKSKHFYLTLESQTGIQISLMAQSKPDSDHTKKKRPVNKKPTEDKPADAAQ